MGTLAAVSDQPINLSSGLPTTVLPAPDPAVARALADALEQPPAQRRSAVAAVVASSPRFLDGWAALGDLGRDTIERYAAYRVGYHRGLDALRANGWRGSGYVRWAEPTNQGFLRCMRGWATWPPRSARPTKPIVAGRSCSSSIRPASRPADACSVWC